MNEAATARQAPTIRPDQRKSPQHELESAENLLKEAELTLIRSEEWLKLIIKRNEQGGALEDAEMEFIRGVMRSEDFEEGTVKFLDDVLKATLASLGMDLNPHQQQLQKIRLKTVQVHLRALGLRLSGLKLMLKGPSQPTN